MSRGIKITWKVQVATYKWAQTKQQRACIHQRRSSEAEWNRAERSHHPGVANQVLMNLAVEAMTQKRGEGGGRHRWLREDNDDDDDDDDDDEARAGSRWDSVLRDDLRWALREAAPGLQDGAAPQLWRRSVSLQSAFYRLTRTLRRRRRRRTALIMLLLWY